jgi:hypothetical protein
MATTDTIDEAKVEAFAGKAIGDLAGAMTTLFCAVGDRLGLMKTLAAHGPATSDELAQRADVQERYAREWLRGFEGQLERAPANAAHAELTERVNFERRDVARDGLPARFDLITTFDVVHDAVDPLAVMRAIRAGLELRERHARRRGPVQRPLPPDRVKERP